MEFEQLQQGLRQMVFETLRMDCDNYFEAVLIEEEIKKLALHLEQFFGLPVLPSQKRLSFQAEEAIKGFGGIMPGQTLYFQTGPGQVIFAMLWPWQDGRHTTLKIVKQ